MFNITFTAYPAVVYLRIDAENIKFTFVVSKARVSTLRAVTIPKMELMAAVLGSRLLTAMKKELELTNVKEFLWSDSKTVL
jgi:hypothetical protein